MGTSDRKKTNSTHSSTGKNRKSGNKKTSSKKKPAPTIVKKKVPPRPSSRPKSAPPQRKGKKEEEEKKERAPRRKITIESHLEKYEKLESFLDEQIDELKRRKEKGTRVFTTIRKSVRELHREAPKIANSKRKSSSSHQNKVSGFVLQCEITKELANFLNIDPETTLCRKDVTNAICVYAHLKPDEKRVHMLKWEYLNPGGKRNLQDPSNKMSILPDSALSKLLRYNQYKKDVKTGKITKNVKNKTTRMVTKVTVTEPTLYYWVVQRLIREHFVSTLKKTDSSLIDDSLEIIS